MSSTIIKCSPKANNHFDKIIKAKDGISFDGKHVLDKLSDFKSITLDAVAGHDGSLDSTDVKIKQVGDLVHVIYNVALTYVPDGSGDVNKITLFSSMLDASPVSKYVNTAVIYKGGHIESTGKSQVIGSTLVVSSTAATPFETDETYRLVGEIFYKTDIVEKCVPCCNFIRKNTYYASIGMQIDNSLLRNYTNWTPIIFGVSASVSIDRSVSQKSYYRIFGDMVHVNFRLDFLYNVLPTDTLIILESLPFTPSITSGNVIANVGSSDLAANSVIYIDDDSKQLKVDLRELVTRITGFIVIEGQIVYPTTDVV